MVKFDGVPICAGRRGRQRTRAPEGEAPAHFSADQRKMRVLLAYGMTVSQVVDHFDGAYTKSQVQHAGNK